VLYRLGAQSRLLIEAFDRSGIPYQAVGQTPLYAHKAVREVLAWLWLLHNPYSQVHLDVVLATGKAAVMVRDLRELGELGELKELRELRELEGAQGNALVDALEAAAASERFSAAQRKRLAGLAALWRQLEHDRGTKPVAQLVEQVAAFVAGQPGEPLSDADAERLRQLARRAVPFENRLSDFLEATALQSETDAYDSRADRVTLMTLHAAKGLEFPVVFIVGCEEGLLPYVRVARSETLRADPQDEAGHSNVMDLEEERRLFYVGLTRAGQKLILTHARTRFLFGQRMENPASRFVSDIEDAFKEVRAMQYRPPERKPESGQMRLF